KKLSEEEKAFLRATATRWNNEGSKPEVKARLAEKHTAKKLAVFVQQMWLDMGVRMLFFVSFRWPNGKITCTELNFNDTLGNGKVYLTVNASFQSARITSCDWLQHNTTYY
ncbi:hypothetical protein BDZ97DRAFT_1589385, partial [Flammula alnicola]